MLRLNFLLALATSASANWLATELYLNTCLEADRYLDDDILLGWSFPSGVPRWSSFAVRSRSEVSAM